MSNSEPPALRRKTATDKLVEKIVKHDSWPIQPDILNPSLLQLTTRKPLWLDLQPIDIKSQWRRNWKSAQVVNSYLVCDPTIRQPGFDLPRECGLYWTVFAPKRDTALPVEGKDDLQTLMCVQLLRDPDDVTHCWILSFDKAESRLIPATLRRWRRCSFLADQLWFMTRIWSCWTLIGNSTHRI